jgi:hypothetical protein
MGSVSIIGAFVIELIRRDWGVLKCGRMFAFRGLFFYSITPTFSFSTVLALSD